MLQHLEPEIAPSLHIIIMLHALGSLCGNAEFFGKSILFFYRVLPEF
jgi:hypothetical protein